MGSATAHGPRPGVWIIGARGSVATTVVVGAAAVAAGLAPPVGCVAELPDFRTAGLTPVGDLVLGGYDITGIPLAKRAEQLVAAGVVPPDPPLSVQHLDPTDPTVKVRAAMSVAKLKLGIRTSLQVVTVDPSCVRGSHGRLPDDPRDGPLLICSDPAYGRERCHVMEVKDLLLRLAGLGPGD